MTTKPSKDMKKADGKGVDDLVSPPSTKHEVYPEVSGRFKGIVLWLGLAFVVMVFLVQQYSGYN
jgi:hypothetical protein